MVPENPGSHFCSCAMLPCTMPTRSDGASRTSSPCDTRHCPQPATAATRHAAPASARIRPRRSATTAAAMAVETVATSSDSAATPPEARELGDRQHRCLAVAERHPREPREQVAAQELRTRPCDRGEPQALPPVTAHGASGHPAGDGRVDRQVGDQQARDWHRGGFRQPAEGDHHVRGPVQRAGEVHRRRSAGRRRSRARRTPRARRGRCRRSRPAVA